MLRSFLGGIPILPAGSQAPILYWRERRELPGETPGGDCPGETVQRKLRGSRAAAEPGLPGAPEASDFRAATADETAEQCLARSGGATSEREARAAFAPSGYPGTQSAPSRRGWERAGRNPL